MAGGASPFADLGHIRVERVDANGGFRLQDLPLDHGHGINPDSLMLSNYDLVTVLPLNERVHNVVTLDGFVRHSGEYELTPGMRLSQALPRDAVLPEAELEQAELRRVDPVTFAVQIRPVSLLKAWSGADDPVLQPLDAISVFSRARFPHTVTLEGEVTRAGAYGITPGERLSDVLKRAGGVSVNGWLPASSFIRRSAAVQEREFRRDFVQRQRLSLAEQQTQLAQAGDSTTAMALMRAQGALTAALAEQSDPGRVVLRLDNEGKWIHSTDDPVLEDGDRLVVPTRPATVTVLGSVMNPGTLVARRRASLGDYVRLAGGVSREADLGHSYVLRASGEAVPRQAAHWIEPGDAIVVPPREAGTGGFGRAFAGSARFLIEVSGTAALIIAASRH
jgi:protein involved in polysaccharide export with SLBB domain